MSEWQLRLMTGSIMLLFALWWLFFASAPVFMLLLFALVLLASHELLAMVRMPQPSVMLLLTLPTWLILLQGGSLFAAMTLLMLLWSLATLLMVKERSMLAAAITRLTWTQWMMAWLMLFAWSLAELRHAEHGLWWIAGACAGIWMADSAAYVAGKRWGKHKLCPAISPGKTIEGVAAGVCCGAALATLIWYGQSLLPMPLALALAVIMVAASILGDLNESALKRIVGVKDSGRLLPGHGGMLDRIDALLTGIPLVAMFVPLVNN